MKDFFVAIKALKMNILRYTMLYLSSGIIFFIRRFWISFKFVILYHRFMSLLIVGSCSKITSNIVLALAKHNIYESITIADPLPLYHHHERYYKLRKNLNEQRSKVPVVLDKLLNV